MRALIVHDHGGPPLRHLLPCWLARARTAVYLPRPERISAADRAYLDELGVPVVGDETPPAHRRGPEDHPPIARAARAYGADALSTASEPYALAVARAAQELGLRGASSMGAAQARDKLLMRDALRRAGFVSPRHRAVTGPDDIVAALSDFGGPLLLKPRRGMSAVGIQPVTRPQDAARAYREALDSFGGFDAIAAGREDFLVEELLVGDASAWYECAGLSDQVCVEGIVVEGRYTPTAITDVTPKVPPFTQSGHLSPTSLPPAAQQRVLDAARRTVAALELSTCATHVELKLMPDGTCAVIEVAARFPGRTIVAQCDHAYATDLGGALADALLHGQDTVQPLSTERVPSRAAATVHLYPSEYLRRLPDRRRGGPSPAYAGLEPLAGLLGPGIRVAGFRERPHGWPVSAHGHEQSHWLVQLHLESDSLPRLRNAVARVRAGFRPRQTADAEQPATADTTPVHLEGKNRACRP
ncbi:MULTISPECIES: ATP-grasp domain-containing protein [unclassified Streptomyces]|uniref:ATP-grasp domain-containing protein n=1 Tax=unclassified Streptomyces TaxID=2593676 RepID=UPI000DAE1217|nr:MULTISPECIES: ATP-grasp domain-containing protein [unclassified Streptomyces]PZT73775.1 hypothetical protein DNK55_16255 [Streptomyces sp. AC1-42T]PZT83230.1 hypothetical protein DNK56_15170 [Streptomyces sp. AC1-42W]